MHVCKSQVTKSCKDPPHFKVVSSRRQGKGRRVTTSCVYRLLPLVKPPPLTFPLAGRGAPVGGPPPRRKWGPPPPPLPPLIPPLAGLGNWLSSLRCFFSSTFKRCSWQYRGYKNKHFYPSDKQLVYLQSATMNKLDIVKQHI